MNLRESFAATHHASLAWSPDHERAIDKVAASGMCDPLGVLLWKARYMLESWAYPQIEEEMFFRMGREFKGYRKINPVILRRVAKQSLTEFVFNKCTTCKGRGHIPNGDLIISCEDCIGSGVRRYTEQDRAEGTGLSKERVAKLQRHFRWCAELMGSLDVEVNREMARQLER